MDMVPSGGLGGGEVGVGDKGGCDPTPVLREVAGRGGGKGQGEVGTVHFVAYVGTSQVRKKQIDDTSCLCVQGHVHMYPRLDTCRSHDMN